MGLFRKIVDVIKAVRNRIVSVLFVRRRRTFCARVDGEFEPLLFIMFYSPLLFLFLYIITRTSVSMNYFEPISGSGVGNSTQHESWRASGGGRNSPYFRSLPTPQRTTHPLS